MHTPTHFPEDMVVGVTEVPDCCQHENLVAPEIGATAECTELSSPDLYDFTRSELALELWKKEGEIEALREKVKKLKGDNVVVVGTQEDRIAAVRLIASMEREEFKKECMEGIASARQARELDCLLDLPYGQTSHKAYNPVVQAFVQTLTKSISGKEKDDQKRCLLQQEAMECLRAARHNNYVSEFHVAFQAVAYALSGSRLVVDMLGHLGPGGSYKLLKDWLVGLGGEPLAVPKGLVLIAFDNEQRLLRNYLSRGSNRSRLDIITNVCCAVLDGQNAMQQDQSLHRRQWKQPNADSIIENMALKDVLGEAAFCDLLFPYLRPRIACLKAAGPNDKVKTLIESLEKEKNHIQCPGCGQLYDKKKRNCSNSNCHVRNVRQARAEASGVSHVSTEQVKVSKEKKRGHWT